MITSKLYDLLKLVAQILLPALGTLYFVLAQIWSLPRAEEVVGTIVAVDTFLGVFLGISQARYNKRVMRGCVLSIIQTDEGETFSLELTDDPDILKTKTEVRFGIQNKWKDIGDLAAKT